MTDPREELRERVAEALANGGPIEDELDAADAVLDALGLEDDGSLWREYGDAVWRHTPVEQDWDDLSRHRRLEHHAIYRLAAPSGPREGNDE